MNFAEAVDHICTSIATRCHALSRGHRAKLHYGSLLESFELGLIEFVIEFVSQNNNNEFVSF